MPYDVYLVVSPWYLNTAPDKAINKLTDKRRQEEIIFKKKCVYVFHIGRR